MRKVRKKNSVRAKKIWDGGDMPSWRGQPLEGGPIPPILDSPDCSPMPLPHSTLFWILSKNIRTHFPVRCPYPQCSSVPLPIHTDTWPQLKYQSSSTFISECGTPSSACFASFSTSSILSSSLLIILLHLILESFDLCLQLFPSSSLLSCILNLLFSISWSSSSPP